MYIPDKHKPPSNSEMISVIRDNPLGSLITSFNDQLVADHIPMILAKDDSVLQGHVAGNNAITDNIVENANVLVIFHGPESYISPAWCNSKQHDPALVPTWNYVVVHVYGKLKFVEDKTWLLQHLNELTNQNEAAVSQEWKVSDAPQTHVDRLCKAITGIEIDIERILGKWKTTIIHSEENTTSVTGALINQGTTNAIEMAELIQQRSKNGYSK